LPKKINKDLAAERMAYLLGVWDILLNSVRTVSEDN